MTGRSPFQTVDLGKRTYQALDLDHPEIVRDVTRDMDDGVAVYYDRRWGLTERFCRFVLDRPELVEGRTVLVAGAGVGLEAVVIGSLAGRIIVNDLAPASLRLAARQLEENGVRDFSVDLGLFQDVALDGVDLVIACFVVYNEETRDAMAQLLRRAAGRGTPVILANEDVGSHFREALDGAAGPIETVAEFERGRVVQVG
ncbi:MAG: hypothetical protein WEA34_02375 [Gemmatimonadota bacterium]